MSRQFEMKEIRVEHEQIKINDLGLGRNPSMFSENHSFIF